MNEILTSLFPLQNSWLLIVTFLLATVSIVLHYQNKDKWAVACLFFTALGLRLFMAHLDPFLHDWDERYHALVARNMMDHPLVPMLRTHPLLPYDFTAWCCNHVWLHKQPLFMWQMALSMKLFGVPEYAIRYPSVLMGAIGVLLIYRIALLMTANKRIAFIAALLTCFSYYHLEMVAGYFGMDQNDVAFDFYVLASIWAYAEYRKKASAKWIVLIGVFAGCAVLNKWLTGLLVYAGWGLNILFTLKDRQSRKEIIHLILSLVVCAIVFVPWQLYILHTFPTEAHYELAYNSKHIWEAVEGHKGDNWYYYDFFNLYFGNYIWLLLPIGLLVLLFAKYYRNKTSIAVVTCFVAVFIFFSLIAQTKIYCYMMVVVPLGYILMAIGVYHLLVLTTLRRWLYIPVMMTVALTVFRLPDITEEHDAKILSNNWALKTQRTKVYKHLKESVPPNTNVILNVPEYEEVELMFFNKGIEAFAWCPNKKDFDQYLAKPENHIAAFHGQNGHVAEPYILQDKRIFIIPIDL
ncbi:MAG: glycosyltransferase family 39 protein [Taibaiella sp.]|nr:glycosyltransferase family 39 protein [Taibaiella sp.]